MRIFTLNKKLRLLGVLLLFWGVFFSGFEFYEVDGDSMNPTLEDGTKVFVNSIYCKIVSPDRGDIIVTDDPNNNSDHLIKRVVGLPNERIMIKNGFIYVDGRKLEEKNKERIMLTRGSIYYLDTTEIKLKYNEYYIIGDNRNYTWYGIIKEKHIIAMLVNQR
mgnify:FL=1|tara:strand:- start:772 stop:1257 length:486 start_codon:yes stop_codon:yes gene_type:complete